MELSEADLKYDGIIFSASTSSTIKPRIKQVHSNEMYYLS